jgi:tRNA nucleotidyltransferase/poly(A) polymerase
VVVVEPGKQRLFALDVVRKLRAAGFDAFWAGGCVRDQLLARMPKDYDVATSATPPQIREIFGHRRTLAIGVAFGVITVLGPRGAGQVEVTTFREDAAYSDGRHPDSVRFGSAQDDTSRRDFTINGLLYDPLEDRVLDYVGGRDDIQRRVIRAIGDPRERFAEDKLRMLRAVRFAAAFGFVLEDATRDAIRQMAEEIIVVSGERIAMEMRRMLTEPGRVDAVRLLLETGLAKPVLPEILPLDDAGRQKLEQALTVLAMLHEPAFPAAMAALLGETVDATAAAAIGFRWRLSNREIDRLGWLLEHRGALDHAREKPWSTVQKVMIAEGIDDLLALHEATLRADGANLDEIEWCRAMRSRPAAELNPPPLLTGNDLMAHGIPSGPLFRALLDVVRDAQLDDRVQTKEQALALVDQWVASQGKG